MDKISKEQRGYIMSRIRSRNTTPELKVKKLLRALGFQFHPKGVYGNPDFADKSRKVALFIDGCFWHRCPSHYKPPQTNGKYWLNKIKINVSRDRKVNRALKQNGYSVVRIWEHDIP